MSKTKSYNQIIFLTTLSVYLGLVLVGASPQVLAQAALTSKFEIKDQIEQKDDLDKKPDDEIKELSGKFGDYLDTAEVFIGNLVKLQKAKKFDTASNSFNVSSNELFTCSGETVAKTGSFSYKHSLSLFIELINLGKRFNLRNYQSLSDCLPNYEFSNEFTRKTEFKANYDKSLLTIKVQFEKDSTQKAIRFYENFTEVVRFYEPENKEPIVKVIYENTTVTAENNQVFIVTRLPRAAIDSLIKQ